MKKEEIETSFGIQYLPCLQFLTQEVREKVRKRCRRSLERKKHFLESRWRHSLFHREMASQREIPFAIKEVHPLIGHGVFAVETIPFLTFIGEYTGVVRKRYRMKDKSNEYVFGYTIGPDDTPWVIDAQAQGNFTRFINHSYQPNLTSTWIILEEISHVVFFANRLIPRGEQLTYDYGPYYWSKRPTPFAL